mgnify:CR=1 FL=1
MLILDVQENVVSFDQFCQNGYTSSSIDPMSVRLVPKSSRLKMLQLSRKDFCLEMFLSSSKMACKFIYELSSKSENPRLENLAYCMHLMMY